ncbi:S9 family peptidase [Parapedobacter koreensis]|uniref:Dipeptidyl aminopeptidase/acylaminoacyl peptidase n=1 Tax=Parapedobacter koreensis TaxID=332977 RepID=A0A1H7GRK9_9SPHI|nr:prolyl oligopeptidase family serine peptidase [Parapedobacter koreensis]SEK40679.1 Dipeptidyl aminopeptidase/acylaminoacyl peptidase [Parapedobacter koreensis]
MNKTLLSLFLLIGTASFTGIRAQEKPPLAWQDIASWQSIRPYNTALSPDGQWLSWTVGPTEGDLKLTLRHTTDTLKYDFTIGGATTTAVFSHNGNYVAFRESPKYAEAKAAEKSRKPLYNKLHVVSLPDTQKVAFEKVKDFSFSGEQPDWIAISFAAPEGAPKGDDAPKGTDLLLYHLPTKKSFNTGNVAAYAFNKTGSYLAYTVDANGKNGNGIFLRDMATGITTALDNDKASYSGIQWNEEGTAFALLKAKKEETYKTPVYSVIGISHINGDNTAKVIYSGIDDEHFPKGQGISEHGATFWSDDLNTLFFGIAKLEKKDDKKDSVKTDTTAIAKADTTGGKDGKKAIAAKPKAKADIEKPDMIIWNWQDKRLQSAQQVQQQRDKNFSFAAAYQVAEKRFVQLADSNMRNVVVGPKQLHAIGYDYSPYEWNNSLDGQSYVDLYLIDLKSGTKKLLLEKYYQSAARGIPFAPNGKLLSYYQDGAYYALDLTTQQTYPLTTQIDASFVNELDDHNVTKPATPHFGWSEDSKYVLIRDNFDLWRITADGKQAISLSDNWKQTKVQVAGAYRIYPDDKALDLKKPQYFSVFNDATKQTGIALLEAGKTGLRILFMDDQGYGGLQKAEDKPVFAFTKESSIKSQEVLVSTAADLVNARQLTDNTPDQDNYAWSPGVRLIDYVSDHGDTLQAALYLPAGYEEGKSYPTITYIYERLTQGLNGYAMPAYPSGGFNRAVYTSNGYAVLMPDIKYKLNDPGMSAVACVVPAVKAAIATGIVDGDNVAIHGHSWGGYQTSFLITQTNIFKAAAAGAPLTNMISMYSLIYWNSGSTNQPIFEASQGRLTPGYWDNWEAFTRNSPIFHIKQVQTPLLLLHNDKDGAVDYTQGIEYYNGLRRLNKPVVMITYKGENHGIAKDPNKKDYAVRMLEFFDHYLKGKSAPEWWERGIDLLDMEKHLEERAF